MNLLIIGAGPNQVPAIRMAKERGLRVTAIDMNPEAAGFALADRRGIVSTRDVEKAVAFARTVRDEDGLDGVMTLASESAVTVAAVAEALGLPGLNLPAARRATHKVERQRCFQSAGVPCPTSFGAASDEMAIALGDELGWPVVVKPADSAGARGVRKVNGPGEMTAAVAELRRYSDQPDFLVERFVRGSEHSIEGVVLDGEVHWTGFTDRNYSKKEMFPPYFLEDGDTLPTELPEAMVRRIREVSTAAVRALGIDWGPAKGDIIILDGEPLVLEMAARLSGDYFCYVTTPLHNGVNILETVMDMSLGIEPDPASLRPQFHRGVALRYVWPAPGVVKAIRGVEEARRIQGVHFVKWEPRWEDIRVGTRIEAPKSMGERVAAVMAVAETRAEAVAIAERAVATVEIVTEPEC
jgi:biotin carboxylase